MTLVGIIGDPIHHTLSPVMHNAVFQKMRLSYLYLPFRVTPQQLAAFLKKVRFWKLKGLNVTIPHKEKVMRHLDRISPEARAIGAVNTVVFRNGRLVGYNTDAGGYLRSLREEMRWNPRGKKILILGAGGAARALLFALARSGGREIYVCNRTLSRGRRLTADFEKKFRKTKIAAMPLKKESLSRIFPRLDLLINTTSIGLKGTRFRNIPLLLLPRKAIVSDLVYRPLMTPLLSAAKRQGLKIHPGTGMLLYQGAESFKLWTGRKPDLKVMRKALLDALERNQ